eukprot:CAMPEP_0172774808 /NCGR_PEP_ID=MMETSP1074-20121228/196851_1 /TAXON_ID=2916 /ORGANISM="Ceratium fusus, Strain PA161109" /LENGTH=107 /DNA_ID=CAMNT_0013611313 /DNA_START=72 /DNA_END=392 /DNA_ORIENTATION=+
MSESRLERLYEELAWGQEALSQRVDDLCRRHDTLNERVAQLLLFTEKIVFTDNQIMRGSGTPTTTDPASQRRVGDSWPAARKTKPKPQPSTLNSPRKLAASSCYDTE